MDLGLGGRVAVITGPAKGMGAAITMAFAAEGARLALVGRDTAAIESVAAQAQAAATEAIIVPCDLTEPAQCEQAAQTTSRTYGRIDILVNVAGGSGPIGKSGVETTPQEFDDIVTLNMHGCFHTMRGVLPTMMAQRYGKIINVGGTFGMRGGAGRMAYSASRGGGAAARGVGGVAVGGWRSPPPHIKLSRAGGGPPKKINFNCVAPGMVD